MDKNSHGEVGRHGNYLLHPHYDQNNFLSITAYRAEHPHQEVGEASFSYQRDYPDQDRCMCELPGCPECGDPDRLPTSEGDARSVALKGWDVYVHPDHRRRGLATAMYEHAKKVSGLPIVAGDFQTPDGQSFLGLAKIYKAISLLKAVSALSS